MVVGLNVTSTGKQEPGAIVTGKPPDGEVMENIGFEEANSGDRQRAYAGIADVQRRMTDAARADGPESDARRDLNLAALQHKEEERIDRRRHRRDAIVAEEARRWIANWRPVPQVGDALRKVRVDQVVERRERCRRSPSRPRPC